MVMSRPVSAGLGSTVRPVIRAPPRAATWSRSVNFPTHGATGATTTVYVFTTAYVWLIRCGNSPFTSCWLPSPNLTTNAQAPRPTTLIATGSLTTPGVGVNPMPVIAFGAAGGGGDGGAGGGPVTAKEGADSPLQFPKPPDVLEHAPGFRY